jgi:hypothetical protein
VSEDPLPKLHCPDPGVCVCVRVGGRQTGGSLKVKLKQQSKKANRFEARIGSGRTR